MPAGNTQLASLTGLRFFAAMAVVLYHLHLYVSQIGDSLALFSYGFTGVSFFFILSGFVLAWSHTDEVPPRRFYWNRFARIWPLHILTMSLSILAPPLPTTSVAGWPAAPLVLTLTQAWIPASPYLNAFNGVSWSLSCEAFFYLMFPLLFRKLGSARRICRIFATVPAALVLAGISLVAVSSIPVANYLLGTMPLYRLGEFVLGMCLALTMKQGWRPRFDLLHAAGLLVVLTLGLLTASMVMSGTTSAVPAMFANLVMIPGFLALIAASAASDLTGGSRVLNTPALVRLGQWSYALYLVHELVIRLARPQLAGLPIVETFTVAVVVVVLSVASSGFLHEFIERPSERWLRSQYSRWSPRRVQHP